MLQHYYATERPLPIGRLLHRLLRAHTKTEREAIDSVARQYWHVTEEGLINGRASAELEKAEGQREHNQIVGKLGGRPRKKTQVVSEMEPENNPSGYENETQVVSKTKPGNNPSQTPDTRHQTPEKKTKARAVPDLGNGTAAGYLSRALREAGIQAQPMEPELRALADAGVTPEMATVAAEEARRAKGNATRIPPGYVYAILRRWLQEPSSAPAAVRDPAQVAAEAVRLLEQRESA